MPLLAALLLLFVPACTNHEKTVERKFGQAQEKLEAGQTDEAIRILEELNHAYPDRLDVVELLAFTHARNNNPLKAARYFVEAARLAPERDDLLLFAAQAFDEAGEQDQAANQYRLYIVDNFNDASGWLALARIEERRKRHLDAIESYRNVHRIRASDDVAVAIGNLFFQLNNIAQAHHWYRTALETPGDAAPDAYLGLIRISLDEENWDKTQQLFGQLDTRFPGRVDSPELAEARAELVRWREAQKELERARLAQAAEAERREKERAAREEEERLARIRAEEEEAAARAEKERLAALAPAPIEESAPEPEAEPEPEGPSPSQLFQEFLAEARARAGAGDRSGAIAQFWQALTIDDSKANVWHELSRVQLRQGNFRDAELTALEALRREPNRESYHLHFLSVIRETHPVRSYLRELERAQDMFPANPEIALALANTYAQSHHSHAEAVRHYRQFIQLAPHDPRRPEVEKSLRNLSQL